MTASDWVKAKRLFAAWPDLRSSETDEGAVRRLADAMVGVRTGAAGWRDIATLTRQVLLEASARGNESPLVVPADPVMPTIDQWGKVGCPAQQNPAGGITVSARSWHPPVSEGWATQAAEADLREVYLGQDSPQSRRLDGVPGDPFWVAAQDHDRYYSVGQRQAARSVMLAPPGSTTIICLPTGHGKTPVALAPALLGGQGDGLSVVVVPTVVLALDMERRTSQLLDERGASSPTGRYAYTGGLPKEVKRQLVDDIRTGRQPVLFTSPEAVAMVLQKPLDDAAEDGLLRYFVIDEAHLVEQWGNEFRPEFQTIAGQRRNWLRRAPAGREPRTVAMSATLTALQVKTLESLLGWPGPVGIVWASQLRSEPSYYIDTFPDEPSRREAVIRALTLLPKPSILYVSEVKDANYWAAHLREIGLCRVTEVTGESNDETRQDAMEGWSGWSAAGPMPTRFDIVVGTSAFGLGIDLPDVKTVVHACMPETVDRYYQEVGRGGRNGSPSIAYMAAAPKDRAVSRNLNALTVLKPETALERWDAMFHQRLLPDSEKTYHLNLDARRATLSKGYATNRKWNVRALNLMVRAKMIELNAPEPPQLSDGESVDAWRMRMQKYYDTLSSRIDVELVDGGANDPDYFKKKIGATRSQIQAGQETALRGLQEAIGGGRCIADVLADHYVVQSPEGLLRTAAACRGCPHCRRTLEPPAKGQFYKAAWHPDPRLVAWPGVPRDPLSRFRGQRQSSISIWWETDEERRDLVPDLLTALCRRGMAVVGGPGVSPPMAHRIQQAASRHPLITDGDDDLLTNFPGPIIWVLDALQTAMNAAEIGRFVSADITYFIHSHRLEHPDKPGARLATVHSSISVRKALRSL